MLMFSNLKPWSDERIENWKQIVGVKHLSGAEVSVALYSQRVLIHPD